ncbi:matrixin family metalloprotease [Methylobacterium sp. M6A4_1b]
MGDYALEGPRWGAGAAGTGGGTVTWAVDGTIPTSFLGILQSAFAAWAASADIAFQQVASTATAQIDFTLGGIDGLGNTVGYANYSFSGQRMQSAAVTFDTGEGWHASGTRVISNQNVDLAVVALHEIGHALGLDHYNAKPEVMNAILNPAVTALGAGDVAGIQALYGAPSAPAAVAAIPAAPVTAPPVTSAVTAVYRFYDTHTGDHFYTTSTAEKLQIQQTLPWFTYEGTPWATPAEGADTVDVFRFFDTVSNAHFFTTSVAERDQVLKTAPSYKYEGVAFEAYADASAAGGLTLERFYNTQTGQHHFAGSAEEANGINHGAAGPNWVDEGKGFTVHLPTDAMLFA